ncbi:MAG: GGDEF domain-containing protein, partial [Clostridia bacterium]
ELSVEKKNPLSLIFIDLDNFKNINDMFGHGAGDYILNQFSINTQKFIKNDVDWIARYGGDEFLICLNNTNYERAKQIANKIKDKTNENNFIYKTKNIKLTCSLGVYTYSDYDNLIDLNEIIHRVDKILYKAKCEGRNCVM